MRWKEKAPGLREATMGEHVAQLTRGERELRWNLLVDGQAVGQFPFKRAQKVGAAKLQEITDKELAEV
jgi:hypothetical protein